MLMHNLTFSGRLKTLWNIVNFHINLGIDGYILLLELESMQISMLGCCGLFGSLYCI